ncbi:MAG: hypothetical protein DLM56_12425 [Pseudonocardiales bacterium]|nr:MAG: hypothetical protein DLM56_12425 [Pseudonocardiales bacterium]
MRQHRHQRQHVGQRVRLTYGLAPGPSACNEAAIDNNSAARGTRNCAPGAPAVASPHSSRPGASRPRWSSPPPSSASWRCPSACSFTAVTGTTQKTVAAKSAVYSGARHVVVSVDPIRSRPQTRRVGTVVTRLTGLGVTLNGQPAEVLGVDPATFARFAIWHRQYAGQSIANIARGLAARDGSATPVVIWHPRNAARTNTTAALLRIGAVSIPTVSTGTVTSFPGIQDVYDDLVVIDEDHLRAAIADPAAQRQFEFWADADSPAVRAALAAQGVRQLISISPKQVVDLTNYVAVTWTFGYLESLAVLIAAVAAGGLLLYVATRQRAQVISYVLTRRMGLRRAAHGASLAIEQLALVITALLLGIGLSAVTVELVYRRLDLDPVHPPPPLLSVPVSQAAGAAVVAVVVGAVAAGLAHLASDRTQPSEVLRAEV